MAIIMVQLEIVVREYDIVLADILMSHPEKFLGESSGSLLFFGYSNDKNTGICFSDLRWTGFI